MSNASTKDSDNGNSDDDRSASPPPPTVKFEPTTTSSTAWLENPEHPKLYHPEPSIYAMTRAIADLTLVRPLNLRPGKEIIYLHNVSHGLSNYKAVLAYQRGKVQSVPCSCCVGPNPMGPFQQCVVLGMVHMGACTNCAYDGNGTRCTLRVINADGSSINPNSLKRKAALRREQTVDRTIKEVINVENETAEDRCTTPVLGPGRTGSLSPHIGYARRQAAKDAEHRLSNYTYRSTDGGPLANEADVSNLGAESTSIEGWPDLGRVVSDLLRPGAQRPRGSFMAKRGGKHSHSHIRMKSGSSEDLKRARTTSSTEDGDANQDHPIAQRRRTYTSPTPEDDDEGIHVSAAKTGPLDDNFRLQDIPISASGPVPTAVMNYLLQQPPLRTVAWKKDSTRSLNIKAQVEAAMGYCVGEIVPPCDRCARDLGAFQKCVTVAGNFQQSCASCTYTSRASQCTFHVPNSTKVGVLLATSSTKMPPKKRSHSKKPSSAASPLASSKNIREQVLRPPLEKGSDTLPDGPAITRQTLRALPVPKAILLPPKPNAEPKVRSQRYLKAFSDAQQMSSEELQLELADMKFRIWVLSNVIANAVSGSTTSRYREAQIEFESMSQEEQNLELAGFKFRLSIIQDVLATKEDV